MKNIITLDLTEDGEVYFQQYDEEHFLELLNVSDDWGPRGPHIITAPPHDLQSGERGLIVIRGEIVKPKPIQKVSEWTLE